MKFFHVYNDKYFEGLVKNGFINDNTGFKIQHAFAVPDEMKFIEVNDYTELKTVQLVYEGEQTESITYKIFPNYRTGSVGTTQDDEIIDEFEKETAGNVITVQQLSVKESGEVKWRAFFDYKEVRYILLLSGVDKKEIEQIIDNLYFS